VKLLKCDGNGSYVISRSTTITVGLALAVLTAAMGFAGYSAAQNQTLQDHVTDANVHWSKTALDAAYVPRPEIGAELRAIRLQLDRIEARLERFER
jgi:hypothetical protein